ncbi:hydrolase [Nocardia sp. NPDC050710]|uniref:hydrolase n=1 Tax=Nocardia sp. NPDC050710 TaxID=3157220 RepID=UPI0033C99A29
MGTGQAIALPRRGFEHGEPQVSRNNDWSYRDEIGTIAQAVKQARSASRPVIVLGHSLGAQLAAGYELDHHGADGLITVGGCLSHFRHYPKFGLPVATMASLVPVVTGGFGYLPKPAFGAPGARTLMREWARMVLTGHPPYPTRGTIDTPSLVIALEGDTLAPRGGVEAFADQLFDARHLTRWDYSTTIVPAGASDDHIKWARNPGPVVDRIVVWWHQVHRNATSQNAIGHRHRSSTALDAARTPCRSTSTPAATPATT